MGFNLLILGANKFPYEDITIFLKVSDSFGEFSTTNTTIRVYPLDKSFSDSLNVISKINFNEYHKEKKKIMLKWATNELAHLESSWLNLRRNLSSCSGCSNGENKCTYATCTCTNDLLELVDCSMSEPNVQILLKIKKDVITNLTYFTRSENQSQYLLDRAIQQVQIINSNIEFLSESLIAKTNTFLLDVLKINNQNTILSQIQSLKMLELLNTLINFEIKRDCNCSTIECKSLKNMATTLLNRISESALTNLTYDHTSQKFTTEIFDIYIQKSPICSFSSSSISIGNGNAHLNFNLIINPASLDCNNMIEAQVYVFKSNLFGCGLQSDSKNVIMTEIKNSTTKESLSKIYNIILQNETCPISCSKTLNYCNCPDDYFSITNQMGLVFADLQPINNIPNSTNLTIPIGSNDTNTNSTQLYKSSDFVLAESGVFWASIAWLIILSFQSILLLKAAKLNEFCLAKKVEDQKNISRLACFFYMVMASSELFDAYTIRQRPNSKLIRVMFYHMKIAFIAVFACIASKSRDDSDLNSSLSSIPGYLIVLPYVTLFPIFIVWKLVAIAVSSSSPASSKKILISFISLSSLGCIAGTLSLADKKGEKAQINLHGLFLIVYLLDSIVNLHLNVGLQIILNRIIIENKKVVVKKILSFGIDPVCMIFLNKSVPSQKIFKVMSYNHTQIKIIPSSPTTASQGLTLKSIVDEENLKLHSERKIADRLSIAENEGLQVENV